jgi:hypothetical protein
VAPRHYTLTATTPGETLGSTAETGKIFALAARPVRRPCGAGIVSVIGPPKVRRIAVLEFLIRARAALRAVLLMNDPKVARGAHRQPPTVHTKRAERLIEHRASR